VGRRASRAAGAPAGRRHREQLRIFHLKGLGETTGQMGVATLLPDGPTVGIGAYACSPEESSFEAQFDQIRMQPSVWQPHAV
jgi:regulation of enolase protein 1 (concanavalin A-like superfamily)